MNSWEESSFQLETMLIIIELPWKLNKTDKTNEVNDFLLTLKIDNLEDPHGDFVGAGTKPVNGKSFSDKK